MSAEPDYFRPLPAERLLKRTRPRCAAQRLASLDALPYFR